MRKKIFTLLLAVAASIGTMFAESAVIYSETFSTSQGSFTIDNKSLSSGLTYVWKWKSADYGIVASAYVSNTNHASESWLISPSISLVNYSSATLSFDHAINKGAPTNLKIKISTDNGSTWEDLAISQWPAGTNWTFLNATASLNAYVGKTIKIAFCFVSTTSICPSWEIKNFKVFGDIGSTTSTIPNDEIWYTSSYGKVVTPYDPSLPTIVSNTYNAGKGVIKFVNEVTSIGYHAFYECESLTSVTIPNSVTSIGYYAFCDCTGLTSVTIPNSVTSIGSGAFRDCSSLTSVTIPNSVTEIGEDAFSGCTGLTKVNITDIAAWCNIAFSGSSSNPLYYAKHLYVNDVEVTNLVIPSSVTSIGDYAFSGCSGLTSVTIPNSVTSVGAAAFLDCSGLTSVTIPNSVTSIGEGAFAYCSSLTSVTIGNSVTSIGDYAFEDCTGLTSVTIPNSVTSIGNSAFRECSGLTSVTIPNSVTSIGEGAFGGCSSLTSVTIGNGVTSIGAGAFLDCSGLTSVTIPNGVTSIGREAFEDCTGLTSVTIGNSVTSIGDGAFDGCSSLTSVTINSNSIVSKTYINHSILKDIFGEQVTKYIIGEDVTSIGERAFYNCSGLTSVTIPNSVTSIGERAFRDCSSLTSVTIPNSVTEIGEDAFSGCTGLTKVNITDIAAWCNIAFSGSSSNPLYYAKHLYVNDVEVTDLVIPNSVTNIGDYAFSGCSSLTSVTIGDGLTEIESGVFADCWNLKSVTIGTGIQYINTYAFENCYNLRNIIIYAKSVPTLGVSSLFGIPDEYYVNITIYVLADMVQQYKSAAYWRNFLNILPIGAQQVDVTTTTVTPSATTADIAWPQVSGAASYELVIKDKNGNVVCTLVFDAEGRLTSINFAAPGKDHNRKQTQTAGFAFSITGLESGTTYNYTLTAKDSNGKVLSTETGTFTTEGGSSGEQGVDEVQSDQVPSTKVLRNGQLFILRGEKVYTVTGQEVR